MLQWNVINSETEFSFDKIKLGLEIIPHLPSVEVGALLRKQIVN